MTAREVLDAIARDEPSNPLPWKISFRRSPGGIVAEGSDSVLFPITLASSHSDYTYLLTAVNNTPKLVAALRAVLDLHKPATDERFTCEQCEYFSPCPTQRAITEALGGGA